MRMNAMAAAKTVLQAGAPPLLAEWMLRDNLDVEAATRDCPRADWLIWLADAAGKSDVQLVRAATAAVRASLPLVPAPQWPLDSVLAIGSGESEAPRPTLGDVAEAIVRVQGPPRRVALAVHALCKAVVSHRTLAVRILAGAVVMAAVAEVEVRHPELGRSSTRELSVFLERGVVRRGDATPAAVPLPMVSVLRRLRELVPIVQPHVV